MKLIKNFILTIILVSFASAVHAETKMRITLQLPLKAHLGQNLLVFKKELEKRSDIKVEIYDSAQLYKDKEVPQAVGSGAIEAGVASITRFAGTNPEVDIFYLPFLFDSEKKVRKATKAGSKIRSILDPAIAKTGAIPLYYKAYGSAIMLSNHGGRQLDGSRAPFDQLPSIADAVGGKIEIILDGGIRRGTQVLKALSLGATACSFGKGFLFGLGAGGQEWVEAILQRMHDEIRRDMILLGSKSIKELNKDNIAFR